jgi:superfamily II DNA or RNA helicase
MWGKVTRPTMQQLLPFAPENEPTTVSLPRLVVGPVAYTIGQLWHVVEPAREVSLEGQSEISITARTKERVCHLADGAKVIITDRRKLERPAGIDGVLSRQANGKLVWLNHQKTDAIIADATARGWSAVAKDIASGWDGKFTFKMERSDPEGSIPPGEQGLRPPQIGALYAIGAHWSIYKQPATIVMPTGTGKTEAMLATLANFIRGPLLTIVPSDALRSQTARKFLEFGLLRSLGVLTPDARNPVVGIVARRPRSVDDLKLLEDCNVTISTMAALGLGDAADLAGDIAVRTDTLIVDEAHHVAAKGWSRFREAFTGRVLQFTATPFRRDHQLVDGQVIYNYPLRLAQTDGYFKKISFQPVFDVDEGTADFAIAKAAIDALKRDLNAGLDHLMMARCSSIDRATAVHAIYQQLVPELKPILVHSELLGVDARVAQLRAGESRVVVCVDMLGEGFDLPQLKVAAVHDLHKSLAVLLQFTGRFTRSAPKNIGDATVVANIANPEVSTQLERLYSEDADWNDLLSEMSSEAARAHAELIAFLSASHRLDDQDEPDQQAISNQLLRPVLSTLTYEAASFQPKSFHEGLPSHLEVRAVWLHQPSNTLYFVTAFQPTVRWTRSKEVRDREWALFVLHFDAARKLLFLSSSDHSSTFEPLARAVGGSKIVSGETIFRSLGHINRLIFQNIGVTKQGRRNLRYAMYTGADVAAALSLTERGTSIKSNLSGTGWEGGVPTTIGCSYKGRVWSREQGPIPRFVQWCENVGAKLVDATIDTKDIIANCLIQTEATALPEAEVLGLEWPLELLQQSEERVTLTRVADDQPLSMFDLAFIAKRQSANAIDFQLVHADESVWATFAFELGGPEGYAFRRTSADAVTIKVGRIVRPLEEYFLDYPPLIRFFDLSELDGQLLVGPQSLDALVIPDSSFEEWDWTGVDLKKESYWKRGERREDSIQWRAARHFVDQGFDIIFDDDGSGEAADLVCLKEEKDFIRLALVHCKFAGGDDPGERVKDVVEVSSQAVRSAKWKWKFGDLCKQHIPGRERRLTNDARPTRFLAGDMSRLNGIAKISRLKEVRPEIYVVQPGLSIVGRTPSQTAVLAAAMTYLKETIEVDLQIIGSP